MEIIAFFLNFKSTLNQNQMSLWILNSIASIATVNQVLYACTISVHETCKKLRTCSWRLLFKTCFYKKKYYVHKSCIPIVLNFTLNWYIHNSLECFIPSDQQNKKLKSGIKLLNVVVICLYTYPVSIIFPYHSVSAKC